MSEVKKNFYQEVAEGNEGVEEKNVKSIFFWYDLLSFALSFQLIYILSASMELNFAVTIFSAVFIIITDTLIKLSLMKDSKNYLRFKGQLALVKLWAVPLIILATVTIATLVAVSLGLF